MRKLPIVLALVAGGVAGAGPTLTQQVQNVLTTIDIVPTQIQVDDAFTDHDQALSGLTVIVGDNGFDARIRLRAIHALTKYCATSPCVDGDPAHAALVDVITKTASTPTPTELVLLRGAIEALGLQRVGTDLPLLVAQLQNPSRDIRAATAHALRDLCNTQAIQPLSDHQQNETSSQVKLAISDALRILRQPSPCQ